MKLVHPNINSIIEFEEGWIYLLVIENQHFFSSFISELYAQTCKESGRFVLSENDVPIDISTNAELISQFIPFDVNRKSLLTKLYAKIKENAYNEVNYLATNDLMISVSKYFYDISSNVDGQITFFHEVDFLTLIKATGLKFQDMYDSLAEQLLDYMLNVRQYEHDKLFVFVNLKAYIAENELKSFYRSIVLYKLKVLLIESVTREKEGCEKTLIIDSDLCEI